MRARRPPTWAIACVLALLGGCSSASQPERARHASGWLGLDYNSNAGVGGIDDFVDHRIVYDRNGPVEPTAGEVATPGSSLGDALARSIGAGMSPDIEIDTAAGPPGCTTNPNPTHLCLPTSAADVANYVTGFVRTAQSVLRRFPGKSVLFEPMNEPWSWASPPGTLSGRTAAAQYGAVLARLLPAIATATRPAIPLADVYVPATGMLSDRSSWLPDLYATAPCLAPGGPACLAGAPATPIAGWNVHAYGLPGSQSEGIGSVPRIRSAMRSGQDNVIVSELGFCATDVANGADCGDNVADVVGNSGQAAVWLGQTLLQAAAMHRAGWLRALIVWARGFWFEPLGSGWAMQNPDGTLTAQGNALVQFGDSPIGAR